MPPFTLLFPWVQGLFEELISKLNERNLSNQNYEDRPEVSNAVDIATQDPKSGALPQDTQPLLAQHSAEAL